MSESCDGGEAAGDSVRCEAGDGGRREEWEGGEGYKFDKFDDVGMVSESGHQATFV